MIEGQPIRLSTFVNELAGVARSNPQELNEVATQKTVFPTDAGHPIAETRRIGIKDNNASGYILGIHTHRTFPEEELEAMLQQALDQSKKLRLPWRKYRVDLKQTWEPEDFSKESSLPPYGSSKTTVTSTATTINPDSVRMINSNKDTQQAEIELEGNTMLVRADGRFRSRLKDIASGLDLQTATVRLSPDDTDRLIELSRTTPIAGLSSDQLKRKLQRNTQATFTFTPDSITQITESFFMLDLKTTDVPSLERRLGGVDLYKADGNQTSQIIELSKQYALDEILTTKRLEDVKKASDILRGIYFSAYGNYNISPDKAKDLLNEELQMLQSIYDPTAEKQLQLPPNMPLLVGDVVKKLARELLKEEITEPLENLSVEDYVQFLTSKGYIPPESQTQDSLPDTTIKERHLLQFYKQAYNQQPAEAIDLYQKGYPNTRPLITIDAETIRDGARIKKLKVLSLAKIFSLQIRQPASSSSKNNFGFGRTAHDRNEAQLSTTTNLGRSELLPLQEWACNRIGITFSH